MPSCGNFLLRRLDWSSGGEERLDSDIEMVGFDQEFIVESGEKEGTAAYSGNSEMIHWIKVIAVQTWRSSFNPWNPFKYERKEPTSQIVL